MSSAAPEERFRALVVEDDPAIRRLVEKLLLRHSIEIDTVGDGRSAIEKLSTNHYTVLVLDLMLPDATGFDVIDFMKSRNLRIPIAVVSAVSQQALTKLDLDLVKVVISKPFDVDEFSKAIVGICRDAHRSAHGDA